MGTQAQVEGHLNLQNCQVLPMPMMESTIVCMCCGQEGSSAHRCCPWCGSVLVQMSTSQAWRPNAPTSMSGSFAVQRGPVRQMPPDGLVERSVQETELQQPVPRPLHMSMHGNDWHSNS